MVTTYNSATFRVAMHAVRRPLVEAQVEQTGLPLWAVELPWPCSNLDYEVRMRAVCQWATAEGITASHSETCSGIVSAKLEKSSRRATKALGCPPDRARICTVDNSSSVGHNCRPLPQPALFSLGA